MSAQCPVCPKAETAEGRATPRSVRQPHAPRCCTRPGLLEQYRQRIQIGARPTSTYGAVHFSCSLLAPCWGRSHKGSDCGKTADMGNYWRRVFARAWADTKQSFGWNQKTVTTVLVAVAGLVVTFFQLGFAATVASAIGLLSAGAVLSTIIAGIVLFIWNFFSAQANLYIELSKSSSEKIAALEAALANSQVPPPDYTAVRHIDRLTLREAAFYWCDLPVGRQSMPSNVRNWYEALAAAVRKGELGFVPNYSGYQDEDRQREHQKSRPHLHTEVTRTALQAFAKRHGYDPKFLRDA